MVFRRCRYCGAKNRVDVKTCLRCGRSLVVLNQRQQVQRQLPQMPSQRCHSCEAENGLNARACYRCGTPFVASNRRQQLPRRQQYVAPKPQKKTTMNFRSPRFLIPLLVVFVILAISSFAIFWYYQQQSYDPMAQARQVYHSSDIPVSTATWTTYKDSEYPFTISYPSDWKVNTRDFNGSETILLSYQVATSPDVHALDITCLANPKNLTAQQWTEQYSDLSSQGLQTLASGTDMFVSTGHGQTDFTMYTTVLASKVCEISTEPANSGNSTLINQVVKSFQWQQ